MPRTVKLGRVGSTQDAARELAAAGAAPFTMVIADRQSAARGRSGRGWVSEPGLGLYASLVMPPLAADRAVALGLVASIAALDALLELSAFRPGGAPAIKWPNDLVVPGWRKLGGILVEARSDEVAVVGIGINLAHGSDDLPEVEGGALAPTSVVVETGAAPDRDALAARIRRNLEEGVGVLAARGFGPLVPHWMARSLLGPGDAVVVHDGDDRLVGTFAGIDERGAMLLDEAGGRRRAIYSGDVRLRPAEGAAEP